MRVNKENVSHLIQEHVCMASCRMKTNMRNTHVAFIIKRGKVLGVATNQLGSRARGCGYDERTIHAERAVIKHVGHTKLMGATMIVIRMSRGTEQLVNSEPCHGCRCHVEKCIKKYGLKRLYYSVEAQAPPHPPPMERKKNTHSCYERCVKGK